MTLVVTGASRGIGAAVARQAAERGFAVAVNFATARMQAESVAAEIVAEGGKALAIAGDVASESDVVRLFEIAARELGPITALVNNAGVTGGSSLVGDIDASALQRTLAVNVAGSFLCAREAIRRMARSRGGTGGAIVNLSSIAARLGGGGEWVHYAASKGAIDTFTRGLAVEVASEGIRVNAVSPGLVDTEIHLTSSVPDRLAKAVRSVPIGRAGTADEVARAVLWLLSAEAAYVTGATLEVGGGR